MQNYDLADGPTKKTREKKRSGKKSPKGTIPMNIDEMMAKSKMVEK